MREQRVTAQLLHYGHNSVVATYPKVVSLRDIVSKDNPRVTTDPREHSQENVSFERLSLVNDDECVM